MSAPADGLEPPSLTFHRWFAAVVLRWRLLTATAAVVLLLAIASVLVFPPVYRARASFVANSASVSGLAGTLGAASGLASQLGIPSTTDPSASPAFYGELLRSRELLTRILSSPFADPRDTGAGGSATLLEILDPPNSDPQARLEWALRQLERSVRTDISSRTNIVQLEVDTRWPELSAAIANRAIQLVSGFNLEQRSSTARSKRLYLEERSADARLDLQRNEQLLRSFYEQNRQWRGSPALVYQEAQLRRNVEMAQDLFLALQRQYDAARLEELNSVALITVIDSATVPHRRQWPRYGSLVLSGLIVATLAGLFVAGFAAVYDDWRQRNPAGASTLSEAFRRARREVGLARDRPRRRGRAGPEE